MAVVRVSTVTGAPLPAIRADRIAVIHGGQAWIAPVAEEHPGARRRAELEVVARNGPYWGPGITVDVVLELRGADGQAHLIQVPGAEIKRTA